MRRRMVIAAIIGIILTLLLVTVFFLPSTPLPSTGPAGIAFSDPEVRGAALRHAAGSIDVGNASPMGLAGEAGYIGFNDSIVAVPIRMGRDVDEERYVVYVDVNSSRVMGKEWYARLFSPNDLNITIPPGASWYRRMQSKIEGTSIGPDNIGMVLPTITGIEPRNASVSHFIVDEENLEKYANGSAFEALEFFAYPEANRTAINGTGPVKDVFYGGPGSRSPRSYADRAYFDYDATHYIVVRNANAYDIHIELERSVFG